MVSWRLTQVFPVAEAVEKLMTVLAEEDLATPRPLLHHPPDITGPDTSSEHSSGKDSGVASHKSNEDLAHMPPSAGGSSALAHRSPTTTDTNAGGEYCNKPYML